MMVVVLDIPVNSGVLPFFKVKPIGMLEQLVKEFIARIRRIVVRIITIRNVSQIIIKNVATRMTSFLGNNMSQLNTDFNFAVRQFHICYYSIGRKNPIRIVLKRTLTINNLTIGI